MKLWDKYLYSEHNISANPSKRINLEPPVLYLVVPCKQITKKSKLIEESTKSHVRNDFFLNRFMHAQLYKTTYYFSFFR